MTPKMNILPLWAKIWIALAVLGVASSELVELSYTFNLDAPTSPKLTPFSHRIVKKGVNKYGLWVEMNDFSASEHSGTHIDAPVHFSERGWTLDSVPIRRLWRVPAVLIDVTHHVQNSGVKNYEIKVRDLEMWEAQYGMLPDGCIVLFMTGWGSKVRNLREYSGLDRHNKINFPGEDLRSGDKLNFPGEGLDPLRNRQHYLGPGLEHQIKLNFPGLSKGAAEWLANHATRYHQRWGVIGVGIDTLSLDVGQSVRYPAHVALFANNIYGIENLANLDRLPPTGFYVTVMPIRIGGGSGAPARVLAEVNEPYPPGRFSHSAGPVAPSLALLMPALLVAALRMRGHISA
ncbi:isatin hydrolase-like [Penaeus monodon]|uniref:isatin hydrolase-like n=1 Tax=Penaeus monodon TaxID=6687 RepID=UPI0018A7496A|nr:isatin hydrolase-like [Penaeus monodon]